jgi:hypothetical protein
MNILNTFFKNIFKTSQQIINNINKKGGQEWLLVMRC